MDPLHKEIMSTWLEQAEVVIRDEAVMRVSNFESAVKLCNGMLSCSIAYDAYRTGRWGRGQSNNRAKFAETFNSILLSENIPTNLETAIHELHLETRERPIKDMSGEYRPVEIKDEKNLGEILKVIYRVRSNLIHGGKELSSGRSVRLIKSSFIALFWIMTTIKEHRDYDYE
jgi:hypothetical protein